MSTITRFAICAVTCLVALNPVFADKAKKPRMTAVHTVVSPNYQREKLPDGHWKPETFAFGEGGLMDPSERDASLKALSFLEICEVLAEALAKENYVPTPSEEETDLAIIVYWGKTIPYSDGLLGTSHDGMAQAMSTVGQIRSDMAMQAAASGNPPQADAMQAAQLSSLEGEMTSMMMLQDMSDRARRKANRYNAELLGYAPALSDAFTFASFGPGRSLLDDLEQEIETPRYFVILQAYDARLLFKERKKVMLWMTRFSIRAKGRNFDEELHSMASAASSLFGKKTDKLRRHMLPGKVEMGELEVVGSGKEVEDEIESTEE